MGCSNPHPHGQVWANSFLPNEAEREDRLQHEYFQEHASPLLLDYAQRELAAGERIVVNTEHWLAVVPYWAAGRLKRCCCRKRRCSALPISARYKAKIWRWR